LKFVEIIERYINANWILIVVTQNQLLAVFLLWVVQYHEIC